MGSMPNKELTFFEISTFQKEDNTNAQKAHDINKTWRNEL